MTFSQPGPISYFLPPTWNDSSGDWPTYDIRAIMNHLLPQSQHVQPNQHGNLWGTLPMQTIKESLCDCDRKNTAEPKLNASIGTLVVDWSHLTNEHTWTTQPAKTCTSLGQENCQSQEEYTCCRSRKSLEVAMEPWPAMRVSMHPLWLRHRFQYPV